MSPKDGGCRVCCRGLYSCYWSPPTDRKRRCAGCWFSVVILVCLLTLCWMYICMVTFNDKDDVNWKGFAVMKRWLNWFMVVIVVSAVLASYCVLLLLFALFQVALREPLHLHWLHKILLLLGVILITLGILGISLHWRMEWPTVLLSLQATAPFLHMGGVGALTLLSWFVFHSIQRAHRRGSKILVVVLFFFACTALYLCPLLIHSPCLIDPEDLPPKPALIGHRGAPMLAPENTMMSFRRSAACNVTAFETDVQLSKEGIPFLMHDDAAGFLLRTTDVKEKFPDRDLRYGANLTWEELQSLNAGKWFLNTDPFLSVSQLSAQEKEEAGNQTIPSLLQLLDLAKEHNISVIFDLKNGDGLANDTEDTVKAILGSGIAQDLILWLPSTRREFVKKAAPGFVQVYGSMPDMDKNGGDQLNVKYSALSTTKIRELRQRNVSVNLWVVNERWLFSLLWCSGAASVTTNSCHLLRDTSRPDWTLGPTTYRIVWITLDLLSLLIMFGVFILQMKTFCVCHANDEEKKTLSAWNRRELSPFLPSD